MEEVKEMQFNNPTRGTITFSEMIYSLVDFMEEEPKGKYRLVIGTDSRANGFNGLIKNSSVNSFVDFVTAVVIHRLGRGGRYFWRKESKDKIHTLRQKIYEETNLSLAMAQKLIDGLNKYLKTARGNPIPNPPKYDLEIHIDIGQGGPTRDMIREIVGMIQGYGFNAKTKPEAYAASKVADKHT